MQAPSQHQATFVAHGFRQIPECKLHLTLISYVVAYLLIMMKQNNALILTLGLLPTLACAGHSESEEDDLFNMDIEQLLTITVEGPSKFKQIAAEAPAVISVISRKDIDAFGANSLLEILDRATSISMTGSFFYPQNVASVRGDYQSHSDNHVMLLLNGRPMRESFTGGENFSIYTAFPVDIIKQIEIIRGPGSVLYGSSAYLAVFNIITLSPHATPKKLEFKVGSFDTRSVKASGGYHGDDLAFTAGLSVFKENGWHFSANDNNGNPGYFDAGEDNHSLVVSGHYKELQFNTVLTDAHQDFWGSTSTFAPTQAEQNSREVSSRRFLLDLGYQFDFSPDSYLKTNVSYNSAHFSHYNYDSQSNNLFAEGTFHWAASHKMRWLFGATGWYQDVSSLPGERVPPVPAFSQTWWTFYGQLNYEAGEDLDWIIGAQINKVPNVSANTVPRLGFIYKLDDNSGIKMSYGQAFRAAYGVETNFNLVICCRADGTNRGGLRGNPALEPETVGTTDLQYYIAEKNYQFNGTLFYSTQKDLIERERASDNVLDFVNRGTLDSKGVELEFKYGFNNDWLLSASYTYQTNETKVAGTGEQVKNFTLQPNHQLKIGLSTSFDNGIKLGLFDTYLSRAHDNITWNSNRQLHNPQADAYHLVTANLTLPLSMFSETFSDHSAIKIYGYNLLDEDIYQPELAGRAINTNPLRAGRSVYVSLDWRF